METSGDLDWRWRFRGHQPSPDEYIRALYTDVLAQFIVRRNEGGEPIGIVCAYDANLADGYTYIAAGKFREDDRRPLIFHGILLFVDYLFENWPLRKLYATVPEFNTGQLGSLGQFLALEGRLINHSFRNGKHWDELIYALSREEWLSWRTVALERVRSGTVFRQTDGDYTPVARWKQSSGSAGQGQTDASH